MGTYITHDLYIFCAAINMSCRDKIITPNDSWLLVRLLCHSYLYLQIFILHMGNRATCVILGHLQTRINARKTKQLAFIDTSLLSRLTKAAGEI